jgi:putative oxygen-independent coproporphyrinogen III oxidase
VVRDRGRSADGGALVEAIAADLEAQAALADPARLVSIYFGGGTPSLMRPEHVARLIAHVRALWPAPGALEVTLEANPDDAAPGRFAALAEAGVNRLSLGVQAFDDAALGFLKRNHDAAQARAALEAALKAFPRVSIDLIYALPGQTPQDWAVRVREAAKTGVEHLSAYQLTVEAGTPLARAVGRGAVTPVDGDTAAAFYDAGLDAMAAEAFDAYEVSNFARGPAARARHNLVYWRGEAYAGAGPGAHGRLAVGGARTATETEAGVDAYVARVARGGTGWRLREALSPQAVLEERVLMGLRTDEGVATADLAALGRLAHADPLVEGGWLERVGERLRATRPGRLLLDSVTRDLLA